jgi:hypothetical protein
MCSASIHRKIWDCGKSLVIDPLSKCEPTLIDSRGHHDTREAAYAINLYIENPLNLELHPYFVSDDGRRPLTILELGSGTGIVVATIAEILDKSRGDLVVATDLPEVCPLLIENLQLYTHCQKNRSPTDHIALVRPLAWGNAEHANAIASELASMSTESHRRHLTHVVCSDLVRILWSMRRTA